MNALTETGQFEHLTFSANTFMARHTICRSEILSFSPRLTSVICDVSPIKSLPHAFTSRDTLELRRHLASYTDKPFVAEADGGVYIIIPSLYPSSGFAPTFFFENSSAVLRLLRECGGESYVLSAHTKPKTARITAINREFSKEFFDFYKSLQELFGCVAFDAYALSADERRECVLCQISRLSHFTDCPIELDFGEALIAADEFPKLDFQLLTAFLLTLLYSAKRRAEDRAVHITLDILSGSLLIEAWFKLCVKAPRYAELSEWEHMAYDKNMLFEHSVNENILKIRFNPIRTDWSLLGIKQKTK